MEKVNGLFIPIEALERLMDLKFEFDPESGNIVLSNKNMAEEQIEEQIEEQVEGDLPSEDIADDPVAEYAVAYETLIKYGVNFRSAPNTNEETYIYRMIPKNEMVHVIEQIGDGWLKIEVQDKTVGYISSNTKYTSYMLKESGGKVADSIIAYAEKFYGAPYVFGAKINEERDGDRVFDCSSFTKTVYKDVADIELQRVSYNQAKQGQSVSIDELKRGDLMFFSSSSRNLEIGHVGIYAGDGKILHTYSTKYGVIYSDFSGQWLTRFVKGTRLI